MKGEMDSRIPSDPSASENELGAFVAEFAYRGSRQQLTWAILGFVLCGFALLATIGFFSASADDRSAIMYAVLIPAALAAILLALAFARNPSVRVFADGLAIVNGNRVDVCRWNDVESFWQQLTVNQATLGGIPITAGIKMHQYRLRRLDGKEFKFEENYRKVGDLGEAIRCRTFPVLFAAARAKISKGDAATFGAIEVSQSGIKGTLGPATWDEVKKCDLLISDGMFLLGTGYQRKLGSDVFDKGVVWDSIDKIPNFTVVLALIAQHRPLPVPLQEAFLKGLFEVPSTPSHQ